MDETIRLLTTPTPLRDPILVAAIQGGGALTPSIVASLFERFEPLPIAEIDPDPFYDFTVVRPFTRLVDGERTISWPQIRFLKVALEERDLVLLSAIEPNIGWQRAARAIQEVATAFGVRDAIMLSSFPGGTPHTRPIPLQWFAISPSVPARFGLQSRQPRYEGPATFSMALGTMLKDAGFTVGTLNAIAPFYLGVEPNPFAIRALAGALAREFGITFDLEEVDRHIAEIERQANEQLDASPNLRTFLANLEQQYDEMLAAGRDLLSISDEAPVIEALPDSDRVLADVEALLRAHRGPGSEDGAGGLGSGGSRAL